jgi:hypothetical protein
MVFPKRWYVGRRVWEAIVWGYVEARMECDLGRQRNIGGTRSIWDIGTLSA